MNRVKILALLATVALLALLPVGLYASVPEAPHRFYGTATLAAGTLAPDGTVVGAWIDGVEVATAVVASTYQAGYYVLNVAPAIGQSFAASTVTFTVDGVATGDSISWVTRASNLGDGADLNLSATAAGAAVATPVPTVIAPVVPTVIAHSHEAPAALDIDVLTKELWNDGNIVELIFGVIGASEASLENRLEALEVVVEAGTPPLEIDEINALLMDDGDLIGLIIGFMPSAGDGGQDGAKGDSGAAGAQGAAGAAGSAGSAGATGAQGDSGGGGLAIVSLILAIVALLGVGGAFAMRRKS